jgi:hypothetical protein
MAGLGAALRAKSASGLTRDGAHSPEPMAGIPGGPPCGNRVSGPALTRMLTGSCSLTPPVGSPSDFTLAKLLCKRVDLAEPPPAFSVHSPRAGLGRLACRFSRNNLRVPLVLRVTVKGFLALEHAAFRHEDGRGPPHARRKFFPVSAPVRRRAGRAWLARMHCGCARPSPASRGHRRPT